jgi:hypothetical protein
MFQKPLVGYLIKTGFNVSLHYPFRRCFIRQRYKQLFPRVVTAPRLSKSE